ncbi:hypothetical protein T190820D02B_90017 [Tenacibaculum sp. 190524A05c]
MSFKTHKNKPFTNKNTPMTKYATGEAKNELNSFLKIDFINYKNKENPMEAPKVSIANWSPLMLLKLS